MLGILGGCGGAGASSLCATIVAVAARGSGVTPVLVDLDTIGGGLDVALGAETVPGARWSGLHAAGGRLDPEQLLEGLPRWQSVPFLACDGHVAPSPQAVRSVLRAAREIGPIVVDLGRAPTSARAAALEWISALVIVVPSEIRAVTAAAAILAAAVDDGFGGLTRVVVREDSPVLRARRIADVLDLELAGSMAPDRGLRAGRDRGIDPRRFRRGTRSLAGRLLAWAASAPDRSVVAESEPMTEIAVRQVNRADPVLVTAIRPEIPRRDVVRRDVVRPDGGRRAVRAGDHRLDDANDSAGGHGRARIEVRA
jgi:secretion/DNA translocation related CpaE-like protein